MPGSYVSDALDPVLFNAAIVSKTTTTGSAIELDRADDCRVELKLGTLTGSAGTCDVEVQSSDDNTFSTGVVSHGRFAQFAETATGTKYLLARFTKRYARVVIITGGTTVTSFTLTVTVREEHFHAVVTDTA